MNARIAVERGSEREQELDIAPAPPLPPYGHGRFAAREQEARRRKGLAAARNLKRKAGHDLASVLRFTLDPVTEDVSCDAFLCR
jgi:hypothetical protein